LFSVKARFSLSCVEQFLDKLGKKTVGRPESVWSLPLTNSRAQRGKKNEKHEDFLTNLRRLTLVHEMSGSEDVFRFQEGSVLYFAVTPNASANLEATDN
jgi:hypothetical protein